MHRPLLILTIFPLIFLLTLSAGAQESSIGSTSVLSTGKWFKIPVTTDGIYRIEFSTLKRLGLENPSNPRIFSNNFGQLSYFNDDPAPDDLKENAIYINKGSDNILNEGDYILFYGQGTGRWLYEGSSGDYTYLRHNYSDTAFYFITSGNISAKSVNSASAVSDQPDRFSTSSDALFIHEMESENLLHSGREWYQPVSYSKELVIDPGFTGLIPGEPVKYKLRVLARSSSTTFFNLSENGTGIKSVTVAGINLGSTTGIYAQSVTAEGDCLPSGSTSLFSLAFSNNGLIQARGWLDYLMLQGRISNKFEGNTSFYLDSRSTGSGNVTEFTINTGTQQVTIWDVTDPFVPETITYSRSGNSITFKAKTDTLRKFVAFTLAGTSPAVVSNVPVPNQNLHSSASADMIIITHKLFLPYASRLAGIHRSASGLNSLVVTTDQIYNEFSGGIPDIVAIRNFLRLKFSLQKNTQNPLRYLLLFGDGSYNNRICPPDNPDFVPTWQSINSNVWVSSFTSDDFYGLLEDGEGEDIGTEDLGIGRIPAYDTTIARIAVDKIEKYINGSGKDDWKNIVCLVADDEDGNTHISDAEGLATVIENKAPWINIKKIYFDAFRQETTSTGQFYPDVNKAINEQMNSGSLVFNYVGHGNESSLGHERVVTPETIDTWINRVRLPLFITATCEFSRFDDIETNIATGTFAGKSSSGENILLKENGGAIALMSTTRLVYSAPNYILNRSIFDVAFTRDNEGRAMRLGDIIRIAKNRAGSNTNKRNFLLLGDPAVRLAWPWQGTIITDSINNIPVDQFADTLKALSVITISGHIENDKGNTFEGFNGEVTPLVYGKRSEKETLANDGGQKYKFMEFENILYSGKTMAENGTFRFSFIVPRDMDYTFGEGKVSYYGHDSENEVTGILPGLKVGGFSIVSGTDNSGPSVKLYLNDTLFRSGGLTDANPELFAVIDDKSGINISGTGIGHDIICWLDGDRDNYYILNEYFYYNPGSFTAGTIRFRLSDLDPGNHTLSLKVWDNYNNSSERSVDFRVSDKPGFVLLNVRNYPNPFTDGTMITAEHNRPDEILKIRIDIYNSSGALVRILEESSLSTGYQIYPVIWNGLTGGGLKAGKGLYPYRMTVVTMKGETCTISGRMIIY